MFDSLLNLHPGTETVHCEFLHRHAFSKCFGNVLQIIFFLTVSGKLINMSLKSQTEHDSPSDVYFGRCAFLEEVTLNLVTFRYVLYRKVK